MASFLEDGSNFQDDSLMAPPLTETHLRDATFGTIPKGRPCRCLRFVCGEAYLRAKEFSWLKCASHICVSLR